VVFAGSPEKPKSGFAMLATGVSAGFPKMLNGDAGEFTRAEGAPATLEKLDFDVENPKTGGDLPDPNDGGCASAAFLLSVLPCTFESSVSLLLRDPSSLLESEANPEDPNAEEPKTGADLPKPNNGAAGAGAPSFSPEEIPREDVTPKAGVFEPSVEVEPKTGVVEIAPTDPAEPKEKPPVPMDGAVVPDPKGVLGAAFDEDRGFDAASEAGATVPNVGPANFVSVSVDSSLSPVGRESSTGPVGSNAVD